MDTDQQKLTLKQYFDRAKLQTQAEGINVQEFLSGLDAYIILPEEASGLIAELHLASMEHGDATKSINTQLLASGEQTEELLDRLFTGIQSTAATPETQGLTQFSTSSEIQSATPVVTVTEGRRQVHSDVGEFVQFQHERKSRALNDVEENIRWRRKTVDEFFKKLRKDRLYGSLSDVDEEAVKKTLDETLKKPIYATSKEDAARVFADRVSREDVFKNNKEAAGGFFRTAAADAEISLEPLIDHVTVAAIDTVNRNPTLENARSPLRSFASAVKPDGTQSAEALDAAVRKASIFSAVAVAAPKTPAATPEANLSFGLTIQRTISRDKELVEKQLRVDDIGRKIADSEGFHEFLKRSNQQAVDRSGGKMWNMVTGFSTAAPDQDSIDYVEAFVRTHASSLGSPDVQMTPEHYTAVKNYAEGPHAVHFEFHMPSFSWSFAPGGKKAGTTVIGSVLKGGAAKTAKDLGLKFLTKLGFSATSKIVLGLSNPVGWVILIGTVILPSVWNSVKNGVGKALGAVSAGGLAPIRAASGAFSEAIQNALGTKYEDPLAANGWILALGVAVLPFLLAFLFTTTTIHVQRSSFLPVGVEGGLASDNQQQAFTLSITAVPLIGPGGIPTSITYTVTISSLDGSPLTISDLSVSFSVFGGSGAAPATQNITGSQIAGGSYSFTVPVGAAYNNSLITATATATVDTATQAGVSGSSSVSTIIGNPPTGCFVFGDAGQADAYGHTSSAWDDKSKVLTAIGILSASPELLAKYVCPYGPVTLYRVKADFGGGSVSGPNTMFLYNACVVGSQACMTYTFAHEIGHIINNRPGSTMSDFHNQGIANREGFLWTYPNNLTESEDYAETLGDYVVWKYYSWGPRHGRSGRLNYPGDYPLHYQFAKNMFKIEY